MVIYNYKSPQPYMVEPEMKELIFEYDEMKRTMHPVRQAALFHLKFESIHPFIDGNGQTGRLLLNLELMKAGYPAINVKFADRRRYYDCFTAYKNENIELKKKLGLIPKSNTSPYRDILNIDENKVITNGINNYSSPKEKIKLFLNIFKGREDVFALRWEGENGKSGYSPAYSNEWKKGVCNKPKIKCSECLNRNLTKYDEDMVEKHLSGNKVVGIYALLKDETCNFLAVDFDKKSWMEDAKAFRETVVENGIPLAVEKSR
nr:Fic family protein [Clostridium grantii]